MKRHQVLIPISKEHHQILMLAQLLKKDAPPYRGLPTVLTQKLTYASNKYANLIQSHLERDEHVIYLFLSKFQVFDPILDELYRLMDELRQYFKKIEELDEAKSDLLGSMLEKYVRIKERVLFQEAQKHLTESDFESLSVELNN